jgi:hypothetical protein
MLPKSHDVRTSMHSCCWSPQKTSTTSSNMLWLPQVLPNADTVGVIVEAEMFDVVGGCTIRWVGRRWRTGAR